MAQHTLIAEKEAPMTTTGSGRIRPLMKQTTAGGRPRKDNLAMRGRGRSDGAPCALWTGGQKVDRRQSLMRPRAHWTRSAESARQVPFKPRKIVSVGPAGDDIKETPKPTQVDTSPLKPRRKMQMT